MDLSEVMRRDLGGNLGSYSNDELEKALKGRRVRYFMEVEGRAVYVGLSSGGGMEVKLERRVQYM